MRERDKRATPNDIQSDARIEMVVNYTTRNIKIQNKTDRYIHIYTYVYVYISPTYKRKKKIKLRQTQRFHKHL